jgi:hypothetical protein
MIGLSPKTHISLASLKPADVVNILTVTFKIMSEEILSLN